MNDCRFGQPYSLFHSLDLDWILREIKSLREEGLTLTEIRNELQAIIGSDSETVKNSDALGGSPAADYLKKTETAADSDKLGGYTASHFLSKQVAFDTYLSKSTAANTYLQKTATAADSSQLGGIPAADYLTEDEADAKYALIGADGGVADDSEKLGGLPASDYLTESEAAALYLTETQGDARYLRKTATAANSNKLGGLPAADYLTEDEADARYAPIGSGGGGTPVSKTVVPNSGFINSGAITAYVNNGILKVGGYFESKVATTADGYTPTTICTIPNVAVLGNTYAVAIDHNVTPPITYNLLLVTEGGTTRVQFDPSATAFPAHHWMNFSIFSFTED